MKKFITGIITGAILFTTTSAIASQFNVVKNAFPIFVNGKTADVDAYNINGRTYIQLYDMAEATGLSIQFKDNKIQINTDGKLQTDLNNQQKQPDTNAKTTFYSDYTNVPDFSSISGLKVSERETSQKYNRIELEYKPKGNVSELAKKYITLLETTGFSRVYNIEDDLDFDDNDDDDNDIVYKKGSTYVSVEFDKHDDDDDNEITIRMATKK